VGGGESDILVNLGLLAHQQGDYINACNWLGQALQLCTTTAVYDVSATSAAHILLARAYMARGELDTAEHHLRIYTRMMRDHGRSGEIAVAYRAQLAHLHGDMLTCARLAGYVDAHPPLLEMQWTLFRPDIDQLLDQARAGLSDPALAAAWQAGQALSDAEALDEVL
jgi:tetratricopeptide (TPR) repeat protein